MTLFGDTRENYSINDQKDTETVSGLQMKAFCFRSHTIESKYVLLCDWKQIFVYVHGKLVMSNDTRS
jgi:hypothetical protein